MKGVILAGGSGKRLYPLTRITNKHLLPVYDRPMIYLAVEALVRMGLDDITIITGGNHAGDFVPLLGNGREFGLNRLGFAYQETAGGIADALNLAAPFVGADSVCVMLADNVFEWSLASCRGRFEKQGGGARVLLVELDDVRAYGVAEVSGGHVARIAEKPTTPASRYAVTGCYFYPPGVFNELPRLVRSVRGELEITDVNNSYCARGELQYDFIEGYWADCGESFESYLRAIRLVAERGVNKPMTRNPVARAV